MNKKKDEDNSTIENTSEETSTEMGKVVSLDGMYKNWFIDYASYVILERAVPDIYDGLKPVQRRLLHTMYELEDGRYNKVANIIGHCMKYHPHGDASIGDALVQLGQKELLIDTQGNWGNIFTGDTAAAPRYIEARLSKFALEVIFSPKITKWKLSYDGRNKEPVQLPVKFPLILALGTDGIAVGLASKILPHNFIELIDASVNILQNKPFELYPDFLTGGYIDCNKYNDGLRGGKIRIRAKINQVDKKTLVISEIPFSTTTSSLIESIIAANDKGKIKIKKIEDNSAQNVEIVIALYPDVSADTTIDALYAFTNCEISISPNTCIIDEQTPRFVGVSEILAASTLNTRELLRRELEVKKDELLDHWHAASLEKIFIEKRIYKFIEECETMEEIIDTIFKKLQPFKKLLKKEITQEDVIKLTEIKIKRISRYDSNRAEEVIKNIEIELESVEFNLANITDYTIKYFQNIKKKYSKGRERKTEIRNFETIEAAEVVVANQKLYVNRNEGFAGTALKKDEYVCDCSELDDIICFRNDGTFIVTKVTEKVFVGKDIIHLDIFRKNDERTVYNMIYRDGLRGNVMMKRFSVKGITRDKEYSLTKGTEGSEVLHFTANPNGETEVVTIHLRHKPRLKVLQFDVDFSQLAVKGRNSIGNIVTRHPVRKIVLKSSGVASNQGINIWYDESVRRLNTGEKGLFLGTFHENEKILIITQSGYYRLANFDLSLHIEDDMWIIEKFEPQKPISAVYYDGEQQTYYIKRFEIEATLTKSFFLNEHEDTYLVTASTDWLPRISVKFKKEGARGKKPEEILLSEFPVTKSYKAKGKRLSTLNINEIELLEPLPYEPPENPNDLLFDPNDDIDIQNGDTSESLETKETDDKVKISGENDSKQMTIDF